MNIKRVVLIATLILFSTGCQMLAMKDENVKLTSAQVVALFQGHTVESQSLSTGVTSFTFYAADGSVIQERHWGKRLGKWKVNELGEICLSMEENPFKCREIHQVGEKYYKYRLKKSGKLVKVVRYRQFIPGKVI